MARITINGVTLDPLAQHVAMVAANLEAVDASKSNYILIQTTQPLAAGQKKDLKGQGVEILEYVPDHTYLCHFKPTDLSKIRALPFVAWANTYMQGFKVNPKLYTAAPGPLAPNLLQIQAVPQPVMD